MGVNLAPTSRSMPRELSGAAAQPREIPGVDATPRVEHPSGTGIPPAQSDKFFDNPNIMAAKPGGHGAPTPSTNRTARPGTASESTSSTIAHVAHQLEELNHRLHAGIKISEEFIERWMEPRNARIEARIGILISQRARLKERHAFLNNGLDRAITQLKFFMTQPAAKKDPKLMAQAQQALNNALYGKKKVQELDKLVKRASNFIEKYERTIIPATPALKFLQVLGRMSDAMTGLTSAYRGYHESGSSDPLLKGVEGLLFGVGNFVMAERGGLATVVDNETGRNIAGAYENGASSLVALAHYWVHGSDTSAIEALVNKMKDGRNGMVIQFLSLLTDAVLSLKDPQEMERFANMSLNSPNSFLSIVSHGGKNAYELLDFLRQKGGDLVKALKDFMPR